MTNEHMNAAFTITIVRGMTSQASHDNKACLNIKRFWPFSINEIIPNLYLIPSTSVTKIGPIAMSLKTKKTQAFIRVC